VGGGAYAYDDLGFGPHGVHALDELDVAVVVVLVGDVVGGVVVVRAEIDNHEICGWVLREVPERRVGAVDVSCSATRIRRVIPLVGLSTRIAPAVLIRETDPWVRGDGILCIAQTGG
jgi:hypothetical protein